ncbi:MAG: murein biosynthesis integral membrane protein MurJ [Candidatus Acidiferrales bacterium]
MWKRARPAARDIRHTHPARRADPCETRARDTSLSTSTPNADNSAPASSPPSSRRFGTARSAFLVSAGIFLSRISGLIRDRFFAHYFGNSDAADAFKAAIRIPNFLQNLFGEGVLSASFIPVYASLLAREDVEEADRTAGAVFALLALTASALVLLGVLATPWLIELIAPGFHGEKRELTIRLVRILFPGAGLLVLSAWCLGILNSHRKFFLSYTAPVLWNAAMIATLIIFGARMPEFPLAGALAWGAVVGSALQVGVQFPIVMRLLGRFRLSLEHQRENVRVVIRNFFPVFISRGVVQISAYVDSFLASLLPTGAVAAFSYAQTLYMLPVSLFGMAVSAAELPVMSGQLGNEDEVARALRQRLDAGLRQIAYFVVPSVVAFLVLGDVVVGAIYQSGRFKHDDVIYVWGILAGATVGLLASTLGRLYSSTYYALRDTRTPLRFAIIRVVLTTALGYLCAFILPPLLGIASRWGVAGLTISAGISGWVEFLLLRHYLNRRIGKTGLTFGFSATIWSVAIAAAAAGWAVRHVLPFHRPIPVAIVVLIPYGLIYLGATFALQLPEARSLGALLARFSARR